MSSRCGTLVNTYEVGEGIGVYSEVTHKVGALMLTTGATYWPSKKNGKGGESSLITQVQNYMTKTNLQAEPLEYITNECARRVQRANELGHAYIIMGDMNQSWEKRIKTILASKNGLEIMI